LKNGEHYIPSQGQSRRPQRSGAASDDTDKVKAALEGISFNAVSGKISYDAQHNPVKGAVILHILNGRVEFDSFQELYGD
jgi:hypothetical protein